MMMLVMFFLAFLLGAAAVVMMGLNFLDSDTLALTVTVVIGVVYAIGFIELLHFRATTASLKRALAGLSEQAVAKLKALDEWLIKLHPSLQGSVRARVEGERVALPAPVLTPYLVSLLVMLGLLGTFVGLVETLKGVVVALQGSSELEAIRHSLTAPMGGLGLAFGTSVAGVAASAMLGLMSTLSRRERMLVTRELERRISTDLRRFSRTHEQQETFKALQLQSGSLPLVADKLDALSRNIEQMSSRLGEQLLSNQARFHESVKGLYGELAASVDQSLRDSAARSEQVLSESGRLVGEGIQPALREALAGINADIGRSVERTHEQLSRTVQEQLGALSEGFGQTSEAVARAWRDGLQAQTAANQTLVQGMDVSMQAFDQRFSASCDRLLDSIEKNQTQRGEQQAAADEERLQRWAGSLEKVSGAVVTELSSTADGQRAAFEGVREDMQGLSADMQRLLASSESLVQARIDGEAAWLKGHEQRMAELSDKLSQGLSRLHEAEEQRAESALQRLGGLESVVTEHLASLGKALEEPMTRLIKLASETPRAAAEVIGQLRAEISNNLERDNRMLEERGRLMQELDGLSGSLAESAAAQSAAMQQLVDASSESLRRTGEDFTKQVSTEVAQVSEIADHFSAGAAEIASLGEAFKLAMELYAETNGKLMTGLTQIEQALAQANSRSDEQLGYYVAQAREVIDYSVSTQKEIFDELRQLGAHREAAVPAGLD